MLHTLLVSSSLPTFTKFSRELLDNIEFVRRLRVNRWEQALWLDWQMLARWLQTELPQLVPELQTWARPWLDIGPDCILVNVEPSDAWKIGSDRLVHIYFALLPESHFDKDYFPNVGLSVNTEWEQRDAFRNAIRQHRPEGFISTWASTGGDDPECPFWKAFPLENFLKNGTFQIEPFVKAVASGFASLTALRPVIDKFISSSAPAMKCVRSLRKALILDLETCGNGGPSQDEIIEVGLILVAYDSDTCEPCGVLEQFDGLRDPGKAARAKLSGKFTPAMLASKKLDMGRIEGLIAQADVIISHNAHGFDKPRFERLFPSSKLRTWLCSLQQLPWSTVGAQAANLEYLCEYFGIKNGGPHRALPDAHALLRVLAEKQGSTSYFARLVKSADQKHHQSL